MERYLAADDGRVGGALGDAAALAELFAEIEQTSLVQANQPNKSYANLTERQQFVKRLLSDIQNTAVWSTWTPQARLAALRLLKIQCRDRIVASPIFESNEQQQQPVANPSTASPSHGSAKSISTFGDTEWEREAVKCVANAMLLEEPTRELFVKTRASDAACELLLKKNLNPECHFILLRLLFLITVADPEHCRHLADQLSIATVMVQFLQPDYTNAMSMMTTSECLKLLYNLCMHLPKTEETPHITSGLISPALSDRSHSASSSQEGGAASQPEDTYSISSNTSPSSPLSKSIQNSRNAIAKLQQRFRRSPIRKRSNSVASSDSRVSSSRRDSPNLSEDISEEERKRLALEYVQRKVALKFERLLPFILNMLLNWRPLTTGNPLVPPYSHAVHALLHFPVVEPLKSIWFPPTATHPYAMVDQLIYIANLTVSERNLDGGTNERQIDEELLPLITLLVSLARGDVESKLRLKEAFTPDNIDRTNPIHQGTSLAARIIRAMTAPFLTRSRNMVSEFLYILHDENPDALVERVGFGNVAGFFVMRGIQFKPPAQSSMVDTATGQPVNPITGQRLDSQARASSSKTGTASGEMTQAEKEREAERLFVLFDRLNRTGVIKAVNPLAEAVASGRFEELSDEDELPSDGEGVDTDIEGENDSDTSKNKKEEKTNKENSDKEHNTTTATPDKIATSTIVDTEQ
ncbi:guanine nucleotide exchange factor synembryn-domain-containing protein [Syncephalis fuscata]|nr:guanine nucleotide exchange factor synembryn-domain-containing protein [Syncephalis fuscata]